MLLRIVTAAVLIPWWSRWCGGVRRGCWRRVAALIALVALIEFFALGERVGLRAFASGRCCARWDFLRAVRGGDG